MCDCSKKYQRKKFTHRNAWETKWFRLLTLVPPSRAVLAFLLSTIILILCFSTVLTRCLFDVVELVQASATLIARCSINIAKSFGRTVSALGSAERRSNGVAWTLVAGCDCTRVGDVFAGSTSLAGERNRAGGVVKLSRWAAEEASLAAFEICICNFLLPWFEFFGTPCSFE